MVDTLNFAVQEVWIHRSGTVYYCDNLVRVLERAGTQKAVCYADLTQVPDLLKDHPSGASRLARPPTPDTE